MKTTLASLGLIALFSCSPVSESETESTSDHQNSTALAALTTEEDTLRKPSHYYYLADLDLKQIGEWIIIDSIQPADNFVTFTLLDSMSSANKETRDALFPAFKVVVKKSDGALSEAVGMYAMQYVEAYPREFAERYACCLEELTQVTNYIGYELMMSEEPAAEYKQLLEKINHNYPKANQDKTIKAFRERLEAYMREFEG